VVVGGLLAHSILIENKFLIKIMIVYVSMEEHVGGKVCGTKV